MTLWLFAQIPTVRPARNKSAIMRAPVNVLPDRADLDCERAAPNRQHQAPRRSEGTFSWPGGPASPCPTGVHAQQEIASGEIRSIMRLQAIGSHPLAKAHQSGLLLRVG